MSSFTRLRVVTTDIGHEPCLTPYPRKSTARAQSHVPGCDKPPNSSKSSSAGIRVLLKASSSSPNLYLEGVFRVFPWLR
jgi:hypothetical protein